MSGRPIKRTLRERRKTHQATCYYFQLHTDGR